MEEKKRIQAEIAGFEKELNNITSSAKGDQEIIGSEIMKKKKQLELKIHQARKRLRELKKQEREKIENLADSMRNLNTLPGPVLVLVIAVFLSIRRVVKRKRSISHASDA
jgi:septal ring factor EnvC (AmiA/AmiB activator)